MSGISVGSKIEDTLTGNEDSDRLSGLAGNDILYGGGGQDTLDGGTGHDILDGGEGNDILLGGAGNDTLVYDANDTRVDGGSGWDILDASLETGSVTIDLGDSKRYKNIEAVLGGTANDRLIGTSAANYLAGGNGDDTLDGGKGADTLVGGLGNDTYFVDHSRDVIREYTEEGIDIVISSVSYTLADNIENLQLSLKGNNKALGNSLHNILQGNSGANQLWGMDGNDTLYGDDGRDTLKGGNGNDVMVGGAGDDVFFVDNIADLVIEADNAGKDTIMASTDYRLADDTYIEKLILMTGTGNYNAWGNSHNDYLAGNGNDNILDGGQGADSLLGGAGNDTLVYDAQDTLVDGGSGFDVLSAAVAAQAVTIDLKTRVYKNVEVVQGSAYDDTLYGTTAANRLVGGMGDDWLEGRGGADTLVGGDGNDTLVYYAGRTAQFDGGAGNDILQAVASGKKGAKISLTELGAQCTSIEILAGTNYNDTLTGGLTGIDTLDGGMGNDLYIGGAAQDTVLFSPGSGNDTIRGASHDDIIWLTGLTAEDLVGYIQSTTKKSTATNLILTSSDINNHFNDTVILQDFDYENCPHFMLDGSEIQLVQTSEGHYTFGDVENIYGSLGADSLVATDGGIMVRGLVGDDTIYGAAGDDQLYGDAGKDVLYARGGNDTLYGGDGNDTYIMGAEHQTNVTIAADASNGSDILWLQEDETTSTTTGITINDFFTNLTTGKAEVSAQVVGNDVLLDLDSYGSVCLQDYLIDDSNHVKFSIKTEGSSKEKYIFTNATLSVGSASGTSLQLAENQNHIFFGLEGDDTITGSNKQNLLIGGGGNDFLKAGSGSQRNFLLGGDGNDTLTGGGAQDVLTGGAGNDIMCGGHGGYDVYQFYAGSGHDTIDDQIDGNSLAANVLNFTGMAPGDIDSIYANSSGLHLTYGEDTIDILGTNWKSFIFRFDIADNKGSNKYVFDNDTFRAYK